MQSKLQTWWTTILAASPSRIRRRGSSYRASALTGAALMFGRCLAIWLRYDYLRLAERASGNRRDVPIQADSDRQHRARLAVLGE